MPTTPPQISVVDDDELTLIALSRLLRACDFHPATFASGPAFLDSLTTSLPCCILLDIQMPDLNGYEVMAEMTATGYAIPVILITGDTDPAVNEKAANAGAVALLSKPFTDVQMLAAIGKALGGVDFI